jgi:hypothetical protein
MIVMIHILLCWTMAKVYTLFWVPPRDRLEPFKIHCFVCLFVFLREIYGDERDWLGGIWWTPPHSQGQRVCRHQPTVVPGSSRQDDALCQLTDLKKHILNAQWSFDDLGSTEGDHESGRHSKKQLTTTNDETCYSLTMVEQHHSNLRAIRKTWQSLF